MESRIATMAAASFLLIAAVLVSLVLLVQMVFKIRGKAVLTAAVLVRLVVNGRHLLNLKDLALSTYL